MVLLSGSNELQYAPPPRRRAAEPVPVEHGSHCGALEA
jgi:hypothetical protein